MLTLYVIVGIIFHSLHICVSRLTLKIFFLLISIFFFDYENCVTPSICWVKLNFVPDTQKQSFLFEINSIGSHISMNQNDDVTAVNLFE